MNIQFVILMASEIFYSRHYDFLKNFMELL